ncbi:hypothetical protein Ancab_015215 [Ancistrocladus abbreviatus]
MAGGSLKRIKLGTQGLEVSAQGLGCMGMSMAYGPPNPEEDMIKLIPHVINSEKEACIIVLQRIGVIWLRCGRLLKGHCGVSVEKSDGQS